MLLKFDLKYAGAAALLAHTVKAEIDWMHIEDEVIVLRLDEEKITNRHFRGEAKELGILRPE